MQPHLPLQLLLHQLQSHLVEFGILAIVILVPLAAFSLFLRWAFRKLREEPVLFLASVAISGLLTYFS